MFSMEELFCQRKQFKSGGYCFVWENELIILVWKGGCVREIDFSLEEWGFFGENDSNVEEWFCQKY